MTIPPAKLKAYLGKLKEDVLDGENDTGQGLKALFLLELVQRGVLPTVSYRDDVSKIVEAIRSTAGKALLDSGLPKPLLAGASAMAGMVAEKCVSFLDSSQTVSLPGVMEAEARCKDVDDNRLLNLLRVSSTGSDEQRTQLLHIAEGCYLRAASFLPDPPQMWKKAHDAVVARSLSQQEPLEAVYPIENLIRIADSKSNAKRVSELSLRLTESWLSTPMDENSAIAKAFVSPFRPKVQSSASKARQSLKKCDVSFLDADGILWYELSALRIEVESETVAIDELAQEKLTAAKNRGTSASIVTCKAASRNERLLETIVDDPMESAAADLRDTVLSRLGDSSSKLESAMRLLKTYVERLQERSQVAGVASLKIKPNCTKEHALKSWTTLTAFVEPVLQRIYALSTRHEADDSRKENVVAFLRTLEGAPVGMIETCALAASSCLWMGCGRQDNFLSFELQEFLYDLLSCLSEKVSQRYKEYKQQEAINALVKATSGEADVARINFECSVAAVAAVVQLRSDRAPTQDLTDQALSFSDKYAPYAGQFGMSYLLFLNVWSGFRQTPWSYCNVTQARAVVKLARACLKKAAADWGREPSTMEALMLDMAEADVEGGFLVGGLAKVASKLYHGCLEQAATLSRSDHQLVVRAHCLAGLSRLSLGGYVEQEGNDDGHKSVAALTEEFARMSLCEAERLSPEEVSGLYLGTSSSLDSTKAFHKSLARQLVADSLVRAGHPMDAEAFLEAAVEDTPEDFDAALALGAFRLRTAFFPTKEQPSSSGKAAKTQLMKAAKLNSSKASPFALLGFWYEENGDAKRAAGCYSKALLQDASHPVAGRGILRLRSYTEAQTVCLAATNTNSPLNGWAWRAMGIHKAMSDADNDMAVICFQESLRCKDIVSSQNESMSLFYSPSKDSKAASTESAEVWSDLAGCYRRLGRYTAAIRAFESAWLSSGENLPPAILTSWAQIQLELGLVDEAAEKFGLALDQGDKSVVPVASYGQGCALLSVAQRDLQDGKATFAHRNLEKAVTVVRGSLIQDNQKSSPSFRCAMKLLGDMHTFGAGLPPHVFADSESGEIDSLERTMHLLRNQTSFIAQGEECYRSAEVVKPSDGEDDEMFRSALACDVGTNVLFQAHLLSVLNGEGQGTSSNLSLTETILFTEVRSAFDRSADAFKRSIELNPLFSPAWCGLGCAVAGSDPLLAQHALARALQLDKGLPDAWANLGFLYAGRNAYTLAVSVMDELTQVADTPMMWICRAAMLERQAFEQSDEDAKRLKLSQAADAYRAAVQVMKEPTALLGVGMTCRVTDTEETKQQSYGYLSEFLGSTSNRSAGVSLLHSAMSVDEGINKTKAGPSHWKDELIQNSLASIDQLSQTAGQVFGVPSEESDLAAESKQGEVDMKLIGGLREQFNKNTGEVQKFRSQNLQLEIMTDPSNGRVWLALTKSLAKDLLKMKGDKRRKLVLQTLESTILASERAVKILCGQIATSGRDGAFVQAGDAAEALALSFCVKETQKELLADMKKPPDIISANGYDLQRALFMCPDSCLAREALSSQIN
jgi:tetratricopeptide (TPR) repeat protein